ncbi:chromosome transmission fidelity protein 8 homolog [Galendromus occidentalis]|uniref:Chromosome transmission fidelity protein 8 homolog n=1 Tax=Galendromus occidentalis TaxID=34638 RepID=A0AAJ6QU32_9ACAR|nr:chromosome transmission fidelity protein 8 homolog [Galendromus occidentalis]
MQLLIKCAMEPASIPEWGIVELQGDIKHREGEESPLNDLHVGDLHFTKDGVPVILIGHHVLYGKVVNLASPYMVTKRVRSEKGTSFEVQAVIKSKVVFRTRPKPIVTNVAKK